MRRFIAVLSALALVALVAGPVAATKPATFSTGLTIDGVAAAGSYNGGFFIPTGGGAYPGTPMHELDVVATTANPPLAVNQLYPFYLKASDTQKAALTAYFSKITDPAQLAQITAQINGTKPFFYLKCVGMGVATDPCELIDGFMYGLSNGAVLNPLRIDDDYVVGTFKYTGNLGALSAQVKMKVYRV